MSKAATPKIITANSLSSGAVVFFSETGEWVRDVAAARLYADADSAEEGLLLAQKDAERSIIVDPFVADNGPDSDGKPGMSLRDRIRAFGPTIDYLRPAGKAV